MYLDFNDEQKELRSTAERFIKEQVQSAKIRQIMQTDSAHDADLWKKLAELGWTGLAVPEEYGGVGQDWLTMAALLEKMGYGVVPGPFFATAVLGVAALREAGTEEQKTEFLPKIAEGDLVVTIAYLEQGDNEIVGQKFSDVKTTATAAGSNYALNGTKMFALDADKADIMVVAANTPEGPGLFLVKKDQSVTVDVLDGMDLTRRTTRVTFKDSPAQLMKFGEEANAAMNNILSIGAVMVAAESLGGMEWILEASVAYAKQREQYGHPIGAYQAVAHRLADVALDVQSARSAVLNGCWVLDNVSSARDKTIAVAMAKAFVCDAYRNTANSGIQVHGGIGFTWEHDMHLYFRRANSNWSMLGTPSQHREMMIGELNPEEAQPIPVTA
jgi:alkylation response protein AidB-like acyl-CoA dehydrogenase